MGLHRLLWVRFVVDWVQVFARSWSPRGVLLVLLEFVYSITDPPIKALRRVIPPLRIGNFALDLRFIIVMIVAYVLLQFSRGSDLDRPDRRALDGACTSPRRLSCGCAHGSSALRCPRQALRFTDVSEMNG